MSGPRRGLLPEVIARRYIEVNRKKCAVESGTKCTRVPSKKRGSVDASTSFTASRGSQTRESWKVTVAPKLGSVGK